MYSMCVVVVYNLTILAFKADVHIHVNRLWNYEAYFTHYLLHVDWVVEWHACEPNVEA